MRHALPQSRLTKPEQVGGNVYLFIPAVKNLTTEIIKQKNGHAESPFTVRPYVSPDGTLYLRRNRPLPFPAETAFSARRNRLFRASEKHISYGGRACLAAQERLFRIALRQFSDDRKGKPADCQHDRQTAKKPRIYSRKTVRAQILPYFRITMNIYSHSAQRFAYSCVLCSARHYVSCRPACSPPSPRRSMKTPSQVALRHVPFIFFRMQNSGV